MTKLDNTTESAGAEALGKIPDLTDKISLALTHTDELLRCALDSTDVPTSCDIAREKLRQIENLLMMAQEKIVEVRRSTLTVFRLTRRETAA